MGSLHCFTTSPTKSSADPSNSIGRSVRLSDSLEATVDLAADKQAAISLIEVRLEHPAPAAWNLTELHQALAHPGD